jgi:hypothetical protein
MAKVAAAVVVRQQVGPCAKRRHLPGLAKLRGTAASAGSTPSLLLPPHWHAKALSVGAIVCSRKVHARLLPISSRILRLRLLVPLCRRGRRWRCLLLTSGFLLRLGLERLHRETQNGQR